MFTDPSVNKKCREHFKKLLQYVVSVNSAVGFWGKSYAEDEGIFFCCQVNADVAI